MISGGRLAGALRFPAMILLAATLLAGERARAAGDQPIPLPARPLDLSAPPPGREAAPAKPKPKPTPKASAPAAVPQDAASTGPTKAKPAAAKDGAAKPKVPAKAGGPSKPPAPASPPPARVEEEDEPVLPAAEKPESPQKPEKPDCVAALRAAGFGVEEAEAPADAKEACTIETPVRLGSAPVRSRPGQVVRFPDKPLIDCRFAEAFGRWAGDLAAPLIAGALRTELTAIETGPGFECRNRNRAAKGKLSAHATGLAVDVASFQLANGAAIRVGQSGSGAMNAALASLRKAACGWFTTILGPGSDGAHEQHLHLDIIPHGSSDRYRICR